MEVLPLACVSASHVLLAARAASADLAASDASATRVGSGCYEAGLMYPWIERTVRGDIVNFAARNSNVLQFTIVQIGQGGLQPRALPPLQKQIPISIEQAEDALCP